jgi:precorrin-6B methylase 2
MSHNIAYRTDQLVRYFTHNRVTWAQFYESERVIIDALPLQPQQTVLDIGCGCGGLGLALRERFDIRNYTGVEINPAAAAAGRVMNPDARILCGDILDLSQGELRTKQFDVVFSLSCIDWNVQFDEMLDAAWSRVTAGGHLVATFRLTDEQGCNDLEKSYQFINYEGVREGERAAYVVLNSRELIRKLAAFDPAAISAYGYWGPPSGTAVTSYTRLCFCAFSVQKRLTPGEPLRLTLQLPAPLLEGVEPSGR